MLLTGSNAEVEPSTRVSQRETDTVRMREILPIKRESEVRLDRLKVEG